MDENGSYLQGITKYVWRYTHFSLKHDYGRKGTAKSCWSVGNGPWVLIFKQTWNRIMTTRTLGFHPKQKCLILYFTSRHWCPSKRHIAAQPPSQIKNTGVDHEKSAFDMDPTKTFRFFSCSIGSRQTCAFHFIFQTHNFIFQRLSANPKSTSAPVVLYTPFF